MLIRAALGLINQPTNAFAVYAGTLSTLVRAAGDDGLLVLVDDFQWLDAASQGAIRFVARRIGAEGLAIVVTVRDDAEAVDLGLPELGLAGLPVPQALALVAQTGVRLVDHVARDLVAVTRGNPLALREIPALLSEGQRQGVEALPDPFPVGPTIERAFGQRLRALDPASRACLAATAASDSGEIEAVLAVCTAIGLNASCLETIEKSGFVRIDGHVVRFQHPLARAVAYRQGPPAVLRAAHAAYASGTGGSANPERRAWHLGQAAVGPDESVAGALEEAGKRSASVSAHAAAAAAFERAAELSPTLDDRARRHLSAAVELQAQGSFGTSFALLDLALGETSDPLLVTKIQQSRGRAHNWAGTPLEGNRILVEQAEKVAEADPEEAAQLLVEAVASVAAAGFVHRALSTAERAYALVEGRYPRTEPLARAMLASVQVLAGQTDAARRHLHALDQRGQLSEVVGSAVVPWTVLHPLGWLEQYERFELILSQAIAWARSATEGRALSAFLLLAADFNFHTGAWPEGIAAASEAIRLAEETDQTHGRQHGSVLLARYEAVQGREVACREHLAYSRRVTEAQGIGASKTYIQSVLGLLELGLGHPERAIDALEPLVLITQKYGLHHPGVIRWRGDLIEAYIRAGRTRDASAALAVLDEEAARTGSRWAAGAAEMCRALMEKNVQVHAEAAATLFRDLPDPFNEGRARLVLGERLRRDGQREAARPPLRAALSRFEQLGAEPFIERTRAELAATGAAVHRRTQPASDRLTPQELQVAVLVARGATNREAATSLFLSPKTVEYHLRNVYGKLQLRSRTELAMLIAKGPDAMPGGAYRT